VHVMGLRDGNSYTRSRGKEGTLLFCLVFSCFLRVSGVSFWDALTRGLNRERHFVIS